MTTEQKNITIVIYAFCFAAREKKSLLILYHIYWKITRVCRKVFCVLNILEVTVLFGIEILGTGSSVPKLNVTNDDLAKIVETNDEWISSRTGISSRRISDGEPTWKMGG